MLVPAPPIPALSLRVEDKLDHLVRVFAQQRWLAHHKRSVPGAD